MENKHTILTNTPTWNKSYGKQGEQLLRSGGHSASLDETNKYRGQCEQPNNHQMVTVMQQATLINMNINNMNHNRRTALERNPNGKQPKFHADIIQTEHKVCRVSSFFPKSGHLGTFALLKII